MKKLFFLSLLCSLFWQCQSKKIVNTENKTALKVIETPANLDYFIGNWGITKNVIITQNKTAEKPLKPCQSNSYWRFYKKNTIVFIQKFTAKGTNCSEMINTQPGIVKNLEQGRLVYLLDDVLHSDQIEMINENQFSINENEIINGKKAMIQSIFTKK